jgi:hypothetical protein
MPKKDWKAQYEQTRIDELSVSKELSQDLLNQVSKLQIINASLRERLRLVEIAARGE